MRIGIYTDDAFLLRKIALILDGRCEVEGVSSADGVLGFDTVILDCRGGREYDGCDGVRIIEEELSRAGDIPYPFSHDAISALLSAESSRQGARLVLEANREHARLDGERIRLTDVEGKLLAAILDGRGDYVTREALTERVWGDGATSGLLNVYVHYLREKLETRGEKIILSSRKCGYKIDSKYIEGGSAC